MIMCNLVNKKCPWAKSLNDGGQIESILLDFSKAFDKVSQRKLCLKLQYYGIRGKLLKWVKDFLYNRTQTASKRFR